MSNTALMFAAHGNKSHCVSELLENGCDITATNMDGETAYSLAVKHGSKSGKSNLYNKYIIIMLFFKFKLK